MAKKKIEEETMITYDNDNDKMECATLLLLLYT